MKIRLLVMFAAVGALAAPSTMGAGTVLLSEDFEGYVIGSNLAGQGGWFQPNPMSVDPMLISNGTGLASKVANGHIMAGSNQSHVSKLLAGPLNTSDVSTLVADAYAFTPGPFTNNTELRLESSVGTFFMRWQAESFVGSPRWRFIVKDEPIEDVVGFFDEAIRLEIVVDGVLGEVFGRVVHGGGTVETSHFPITVPEILSLDLVEMYADYRDSSTYLGGEFDNLTVITLPVELQSFAIE